MDKMHETYASLPHGMIGLLFFFGFFVAMLVWLFWPGKKSSFEDQGKIPLKDDNDE